MIVSSGDEMERRKPIIGGVFLTVGASMLVIGLYWANIATWYTFDGSLVSDTPLLYSGLGLAAIGGILGFIGFLMLVFEYLRAPSHLETVSRSRPGKCVECGHKNPQAASYCNGCGAPLD
jgi:hypothetical protein